MGSRGEWFPSAFLIISSLHGDLVSTCTYTRASELRCHLGPDPFLWPSWMLQILGQQIHLGQQGREKVRNGVAQASSRTVSQEQKQQAV